MTVTIQEDPKPTSVADVEKTPANTVKYRARRSSSLKRTVVRGWGQARVIMSAGIGTFNFLMTLITVFSYIEYQNQVLFLQDHPPDKLEFFCDPPTSIFPMGTNETKNLKYTLAAMNCDSKGDCQCWLADCWQTDQSDCYDPANIIPLDMEPLEWVYCENGGDKLAILENSTNFSLRSLERLYFPYLVGFGCYTVQTNVTTSVSGVETVDAYATLIPTVHSLTRPKAILLACIALAVVTLGKEFLRIFILLAAGGSKFFQRTSLVMLTLGSPIVLPLLFCIPFYRELLIYCVVDATTPSIIFLDYLIDDGFAFSVSVAFFVSTNNELGTITALKFMGSGIFLFVCLVRLLLYGCQSSKDVEQGSRKQSKLLYSNFAPDLAPK